MKASVFSLCTLFFLVLFVGCKDEEEPDPGFNLLAVDALMRGTWTYYEKTEDGTRSGRDHEATFSHNGEWTINGTSLHRTGELWEGADTSTKLYDLAKQEGFIIIKIIGELPFKIVAIDAKNMIWERTERAYEGSVDLGSFQVVRYKFKKE
ncbi:hypothetical protein [Rufibacter sp. LB8]|uniref:hypothetical protein n=1 Tax=Rufibacter sp. LB8 TaxID=2777781 RepID=UPI00178C5CD1|nr:hypothetical protein [Rufibacter sp. LB8]